MRKKFFTLIELLLATMVTLIASYYLASIFMRTMDITQRQAGVSHIDEQATLFLDLIEKDIRGMFTRNHHQSGEEHFSLLCTYADSNDDFIFDPDDVYTDDSDPGWPRLSFSTYFREGEADWALSNAGGTDSRPSKFYDGFVKNEASLWDRTSRFYPHGGMKEVVYFCRPFESIGDGKLPDSGFVAVYRQERAPVARKDDHTIAQYGYFYETGTTEPHPRRVVIPKAIYVGYRFLYDDNGQDGIENGEVHTAWNSVFFEPGSAPSTEKVDIFPHFVEVTIALAPHQFSNSNQRGEATESVTVSGKMTSSTVKVDGTINSGSTDLTIKMGMSNSNFLKARNGYLAVPGKGVLYYNIDGYDKDEVTFKVIKARGVPSVSISEGDEIVIAYTYKRTFSLLK